MTAMMRAVSACLLLVMSSSIAFAQDAGGDAADAAPVETSAATFDEYIVPSGESLFSIAQRFDTTVDELRSLNALAEDHQLLAGQSILVPTGGRPYVEIYEIKPGDTLFGISKRFNTRVEILRTLNAIADEGHIEVGQSILVPSVDATAFEVYIVVEDDSLFNIAQRFHTVVSLLKSLNGIADEGHIVAGQSILVPKIDEERFERYTIKTADSLHSISTRYATTEAELVAINGLASALDIEVGQVILVPRIDETLYEVYVMAEGDSLFDVARLYKTSVAQLRLLNGLEGQADVPVGRSIIVPKVDDAVFQRYIVQAGDTLFGISRRFGVSLEALQVLNQFVDSRNIQAGQAILLPASEQETLDVYIVQLGDTLKKIADAHNTTVGYMQSLNGISDPNLIQVDETLVVPKARQLLVRPGFGFGVQVFLDGAEASALADSVARLGVNWVKIDAPWAEIEPEQGVFQYAALDAMVAALELANVNIMLNIYAAPDWSRASFIETLNSQMREYSGPPENLSHLNDFLANLVTRYAGLVEAYEVWKSPNLLKYWMVPVYHQPAEKTEDGDYSFPDEILLGANIYVRLLQAAYETIKSYDAAALVITGGLAPVGFSDNYNSVDTASYLNDMLRHGAADYSDGIGAIFSASAVPPSLTCCDKPPGVESHYESFLQYFQDLLAFYQDTLAANGSGGKPVFVTQLGWGTREGTNLAIPSSGFEWLNYTSEAEQALYVKQAYQLVQNQDSPAVMFLYNLNGCAANDEEACFFSLIDAAGEERPAFAAYAEVPKSAESA